MVVSEKSDFQKAIRFGYPVPLIHHFGWQMWGNINCAASTAIKGSRGKKGPTPEQIRKAKREIEDALKRMLRMLRKL